MAISRSSLERGAYHIANNAVEYNPQRKNNFALVIQDIDGLPRIDSVDSSIASPEIIESCQEQILLALISCQTPQISQGTISINRGNSTIKFPGKPSFNEISISAYDYIGGEAKDVLLAWQALSYNPKYDVVGHAGGNAGNTDITGYKKNIQLLQLDPEGNLVRFWEIKGAWLSSVEPGDFNMDSGDEAQTVDATIVYDWAIMHLPEDWEYTA